MGSRGDALARRRWLNDPLCGTLNYAVGLRVVAAIVALFVGRACWRLNAISLRAFGHV